MSKFTTMHKMKNILKNSNTHSLNDIIDEINYYIVHVIKDLIKQYINSYKIDKSTNNITDQELINRVEFLIL